MAKIVNEKRIDRDENGYFKASIYMLINIADGPENGWSYVGSTTNDSSRKADFMNGRNYSGSKINAALTDGQHTFKREVLEVIVDSDLASLFDRKKEAERKHISSRNAVNQGYNLNYGGPGRCEVSVIAIDKNGEEKHFRSLSEAGRKYGLKEGSVRHWIEQGRPNKQGITFKKHIN